MTISMALFTNNYLAAVFKTTTIKRKKEQQTGFFVFLLFQKTDVVYSCHDFVGIPTRFTAPRLTCTSVKERMDALALSIDNAKCTWFHIIIIIFPCTAAFSTSLPLAFTPHKRHTVFDNLALTSWKNCKTLFFHCTIRARKKKKAHLPILYCCAIFTGVARQHYHVREPTTAAEHSAVPIPAF